MARNVMLQCSDVERMTRSGTTPAGRGERAAYLSHLESCPSCRSALDSAGVDLATMADGPGEAARVLHREGPVTIAGEPVGTIAPTLAGLPDRGTVNGLARTLADEAPIRDPGQDTYSTVAPSQDDAYETRMGGPFTYHEEGGRPRPCSGQATEPDAGPGLVDPTWPVVPGYELVSKLGEGGMGVVYKARQRRLNRLVALKMIRGDGRAGEVQLNRFRIEAEAVARLQHPNIVQIYEIGDVDGLPYFSLELLEGGGLDARLAGTPRPAREAAEMVASLCAAIEAAHQAQIVHRDLKPANVVLAADGTPKVTDFGLAKRLEEEDSHTRTGDVMGSPSYMSPEQARGQVHLVGTASDIYSLGAILYEMLTGRPPFRGTTAWDTVRQVVEEDPVPPSRLQPRVPRDLETIGLKCLDKDPARRYASALAMGEDLRRYLEGVPILARPIPFWERGLKWARRHPAAASLSAVAAAAVAGIVGASIWYAQLVQGRRRDEADQVASLVIRGQEALSRGRERFDKDLGAAQVLVAELEKTLDDQPANRRADPRIALLRRQAALELARIREAARSRDRGAAFRETLARFRTIRDEALFLDTSFEGLQQAGRDPEAGGRKALEALGLFTQGGDDGARSLAPIPPEATAAERSEVVAGSYEMLLLVGEAEARRPGPDPKARAARALRVLDSAPRMAPGVPETRAYHLRRIDLLAAIGDEAGAARERQALAGLRPGDALDHFLYGLEVYRRGRPAEAIAEFQAARVQDPDLFWARALLAISCVRSGRAAEARLVLDECLRDRPDLAWLYVLRGYASGQVGLLGSRRGGSSGRPGAFAAFDEGPARAEGPRDGSAAEFEAAEEDFRQALARLGPGDVDLRYTLHLDRGLVRLWDARLAPAAADFEEAIRLDPARFNAYVNLAGVRLRMGDHDEAIGRLTEALRRTPDEASTAGALRFRALAREQKSARFAARADLDAALARAVRSVAPRPVGLALASQWGVEACRAVEARERQAALDDFAAIRHGPGDRPEEVAADLVGQARLLLRAGRPAEAMAASEAALKADPRYPEAHRIRIGALLDRGLYDQVIASCNACLEAGAPSAGLYAIRAKARVKKEDLAGAIGDFTRSLELRPAQPQVLIDRGWVHLFYGSPHGSPQLALDDFKAAARLDPTNAEAFCGLGNARAALEMHDQAVADAARALRLDVRSSANRLGCARVYALAAEAARARPGRELGTSASSRDYSTRALALLRGAILAQSPADRWPFYRKAILRDDAFRSILRNPRLDQLLRESLPAAGAMAPTGPGDGPAAEARR